MATVDIHNGLQVRNNSVDYSIAPSARQQVMLSEMERYNTTVASGRYAGWMLNRMIKGVPKTWALRHPVAAEQAASAIMTKRMNDVTISGDSVGKVFSAEPGGRFKFNRVLDNKIQMSRGQMPTKQAFIRNKITTTPRSKVKAGVLIDISGSMQAYAQLGLSLAWVIGSAINQLGGEVATVAFSNRVWPIVAPSEQNRAVVMCGTTAGDHLMAKSQLAVDGALDLIDGDGARLLFVFSDGEFGVGGETKYLQEACDSGVHVVWIAPDSVDSEQPVPRGASNFTTVEQADRMTYSELVEKVGDALVQSVKNTQTEGR